MLRELLFAAADGAVDPPRGNPWLNLVILVVIAAVAFPLLGRVRRSATTRRRRTWEREGLLPEQIDPHRPDRDATGGPSGRRSGGSGTDGSDNGKPWPSGQ